MYKTGCMFMELITDLLENKIGWLQYTQADYIFYGDAINKKVYVFNPVDMRNYLKRYPHEYYIKSSRDNRANKYSIGAIVNPANYKKHFTILEIEL